MYNYKRARVSAGPEHPEESRDIDDLIFGAGVYKCESER